MGKSLKKNFVLSLLNTVSGLLFPLITFPYASRILFADGIGQVQFFQSIIDYIALFTALGIPLYAVREIAKIRESTEERSRVSLEILLLHAFLTLFGYIIIIILACTVAKIQVDIPLFILLSSTLFFNAIGVPWFYQAVEDFKYITIRTLIVRMFSLISLFLFVKTKDDLLYYAAITVVANVGGNLFNFFRLRKYIDLSSISWKNLHPSRHLKPALRIFVLNLIVSIYINLDSVMLGFLKNEAAVGFYAGATKLTRAILGVVASLGTVLLPRFSNMISNGQTKEFNVLANKAIGFVVGISLPMVAGLVIMASPIIHLFCGPNFEPSILTLQLISPIIFFIALSGILGMQILYPQGQEKKVIIATLVGAIFSFSLNIILIPKYAQFGSAFSTSVAECIVFLMLIILGRNYITFKWFSKRNFHYLVGTLLVVFTLYILSKFEISELYYLIVGTFVAFIIYATYLLLIKDPIMIEVKNLLNKTLRKK